MLRIICLITTLVSCNENSIEDSDFLAGNTFTDSNIKVVLIDTLTIETSTMKFDSISMSSTNRILVGKYTDSVFGDVKAASYFRFIPENYTIDSDAVFDSLVLHLNYDSYYYNDTLQTNTINLKQLSENLKPKSEDDIFYNTSSVEYNSKTIGSTSFLPRPLEADTLKIKIVDSLGSLIFDKLQDQIITTDDEFLDFFKGITLQPGEEDNGSVIGYSRDATATYMRLYYSIAEEEENVQYSTYFSIDLSSSPTPFFNQITSINPISELASLTNTEMSLSSSSSNNNSYIQSGIGIATKINFPTIKSIYNISGEGTILEANLTIKPKIGSYDDKLMLQDSLSLYLVDQNNDLSGQLYNTSATTIVATLNKDNQEYNDIYYEISLSSYINDLLETDLETEESIILLPNNYNSSVDRSVLNSSTSSDYQSILEITYAIYDEDDN